MFLTLSIGSVVFVFVVEFDPGGIGEGGIGDGAGGGGGGGAM